LAKGEGKRTARRKQKATRRLWILSSAWRYVNPHDGAAKNKKPFCRTIPEEPPARIRSVVFTKRGEPWFCIAGIWRADKAVGEAFTMLKMPAQRAFNHPGQRSSGAAPAFMKCHVL